MAIRIVVPDASVVLKWVLPPADEPDAAKALALRSAIAEESVRAVLPSLWLYEVGNTVARRFPAQAERWIGALMRFQLEEEHPSPSWLRSVLHLTDEYGVAFYDAAYHAVAMVHRGVLVTADRRYFDRAEGAGAVTLLSDWSPP